MKFFKYCFTLVLLLFTSMTFAQGTGTIKGFVYDEETGEPLIFTNVYLKDTQYGATSDVNGYFSLNKIPAGEYTLISSSLGYTEISYKISLKAGQIISQKVILKKSSVDLSTFEVSAEKQEAKTNVQMSVAKVTPKDIESIPTVGGEADLAQYIQVLPGVVFTGDQGGQLYIRGGSPIQNKVLLDGMVIYNPFHSIGLFSVFETDIIRNADIYTGGFSAEHGGRISSIMDITTRDGNKNKLSGKVSASTFGTKALLEGPLKKPKTVGGSSITYLVTAKHSYLDKTDDIFYNNIENEEGLPYSFTDLYGKIAFSGENGTNAKFFGFNFNDKVDYTASKLDWKASGGGTKLVLVPNNSPLLVEAKFSYTKYEIDQQEGTGDTRRDRSSSINGFTGGLDFTYFILKNEIKYGVELNGFTTDFNFRSETNRLIQQKENTTEFSGYFKYKFNFNDRLIIDPSIRGIYYASLSEFSFEPRIGAKYNVSNRIRLKGAGGLYSQNLISATTDRDVVNLFNGFLSGPKDLPENFKQRDGSVKTVDSKLQKAWHAILGAEVDITRKFSVNVEGYLKYFPQLTTLNRFKLFEDNASNQNKDPRLVEDYLVEDGQAYGIDFVFNYKHKGINLFAVYSLAYVDRYDGVNTYNPVFDRRHNVNFVGSYTFGKDLNWEFNARWNFGSGFPFTQTQGNFERIDFGSTGIGTDILSNNGTWGTVYDDINDGRLPSYHRLDLNLKRKFALSLESVLEVNVGVTNVYNRKNMFYFDRREQKRVNQLPVMPSIGMNLSF